MQREKAAGGITAGLMLIGIGVLAFTDSWWPGIMVVIGIAVIGGMLFRGQFLSTLPVALIFFGIPAIIKLGLSWNTFVPLLLIGLGLLSLVDNLARSRRRAAGDGTPHHFEYRSGFWPVIFLGVGTIWLLGNLGYIPGFNPYALVSLWPLLLIGLGLDLLIGRRSVWIGVLLGLAILALAGFLLFTRDDLLPQVELQSAHFSEPVGQASAAEVTLKLVNGQNTLFALEDEDTLIEAYLDFLNEPTFEVQGEQEKIVVLSQSGALFTAILDIIQKGQKAEIGLSPAIPLDLNVEHDGGATALDLAELQIAGLDVRMDGGDVKASLATAPAAQRVDINMDGGNLSFGFPQEASFTFRVVMDGGDLVFEIPSQADVRVEVLRHDGGDVSLPADFALTQGQPGNEGIWESPGFGQAAQQIVITVDDINGGDIVVR
jgi:hypothetical protein